MIVFFGTSPHSAQFLNLAIKNGLKIDLVVSDPPKPVGRKQVMTENPVVILAKKLNIPFIFELDQLVKLKNLDRGVMLDFNKIIPQKIIVLFNKGIINIHFSKLPQYRGPAPVQQTILDGQDKAWITYYLITAGLDEGPILNQTSLPLTGTETTGRLYESLIQKAANEIFLVITDEIRPFQPKGQPSYTSKLTTQNTKIDWSKKPDEIERLIRAVSPEPGAWTTVDIGAINKEPKTRRLKILKAHLENNELVLDQVQLEGKNTVSWKQFQQGYPQAQIRK